MKLSIYKQNESRVVQQPTSPSWLEMQIRTSRHLIENEFKKTREFVQERVDDLIEFEREIKRRVINYR